MEVKDQSFCQHISTRSSRSAPKTMEMLTDSPGCLFLQWDPGKHLLLIFSQWHNLTHCQLVLGKVTQQDPLLSKVRRFTKSGWPQEVKGCLKPYWNRRNELSVEGDCVLWGIRVIVPKKLQNEVLMELHRNHQGIARMKAIARSYVWWPGLDKCLKNVAKNCRMCKSVKSTPTVALLHPWAWPSRPWQRVHVDFAGPLKGSMFFVLVDAHSKWPEVVEMKTTSAMKTIEVMRALFAAYELPEQVVSDNGPQFSSEEFKDFMKGNHIKHMLSTPYHPSTNGLAERFIQTSRKLCGHVRVVVNPCHTDWLISF